jgi:hypothetical protein
VWTVDEPADIRRLLDWGVDAIISDRPDVAAEIVHARPLKRVERSGIIPRGGPR